MKKILFIFIICCNVTFAHKEWVHQWIVKEAYYFLAEQKGGDYMDLRNHIGFGYDGPGSDSDPFATGYVGVGAWREDVEDIVWGLGEAGHGWDVTSTHFWQADQGWDYLTPITASESVPNAYMKARSYLIGETHFDDNDILWFKYQVDEQFGVHYGKFYHINSLIDFKNTGHCWLTAILQQVQNGYSKAYLPQPQEAWMTEPSRSKFAYGILGRVCHLLGDMGVPTHAHNDLHPCGYPWPFNNDDYYELYMGNNHQGNCNAVHYTFPAQYYGHTPAAQQGGLFENIMNLPEPAAYMYLFYTQNQIADFFPSEDLGGNNGLPYGSNTYIDNVYTSYNNTPPTSINANQIASETLRLTIRMTASLLYYFAVHTNQPLVGRPNHLTVSSNMPGLGGSFALYNGATGWLHPNALGTQPISYQWEYYGCDCDRPGSDLIAINGSTYLSYPNIFFSQSINSNTHCPTPNSNWCLSHPLSTWLCSTNEQNAGQNNPLTENIQVKARFRADNSIGCTVTSPDAYHSYTVMFLMEAPPAGCPYIFTYNSASGVTVENNILHRSEFSNYAGQDIKDRYLITTLLDTLNNKIPIQIKETEKDHEYFDRIKLLGVDHPVGTLIGVTENNDIVMYDTTTVQSSDDAALNGGNITPYIQYNYTGPKVIKGYGDDSIYAHYNEGTHLKLLNLFKNKYNMDPRGTSDSLALIGIIGVNPDIPRYPNAKDYAGDATIYTDTDFRSRLFSRREMNSVVIIPIGQISDAVDHIDINWYRDYEVGYFSIVPVMYSGFTINEVPLYSADNSIDGDIGWKLTDIDHDYAEMDSNSVMTL